MALILAIESSCDETAAAVSKDGREILSNVVATQIAEHRLYGGVVPEIASRRHTENINAVVKEAMEKSFASYELAQAKEYKAKLNYERIKKLYQDKLTSKASLEDAEIEYKEASANVLNAFQ